MDKLKRYYQEAPVTSTLVVLNVLVFAITTIFPEIEWKIWFVPLLTTVEPWRLVTSVFVHAGIAHIFFNMVALISLGKIMDTVFGKWRFIGIYTVAALWGSLGIVTFLPISNITDWAQPSVGASGAIFGIFGAYFVLVKKLGGNIQGFISLLVLNVLITFIVPHIAWQAHVGGFLAGVLVGAVYALPVKYLQFSKQTATSELEFIQQKTKLLRRKNIADALAVVLIGLLAVILIWVKWQLLGVSI